MAKPTTVSGRVDDLKALGFYKDLKGFTNYRSNYSEAATAFLEPTKSLSASGVFISPWHDAVQEKDGSWTLPKYPCEIPYLNREDPKFQPWTPGEYILGIDNADADPETGQLREWGGQKMWEGQEPPKDYNPRKFPEHIQRLLDVPHMPGQPFKEMFARLKAINPAHFEDRDYDDILHTLPELWEEMYKRAQWAEKFGINTEDEPGEWLPDVPECLPAVYCTPRPDTVTMCCGYMPEKPDANPLAQTPGAEYDYLEYLYAKDQEGKPIQIFNYSVNGMLRHQYATYSFVPPMGTTSITPYACWKIRGVWKGDTIAWNPEIKNSEMNWFTDMSPEMRKQLANPDQLDRKAKAIIGDIRYGKVRKVEPVLWPEDSWEGNAMKAREWDELNPTTVN
eukprot:gnl/TRDRNA2_/TRDRNA2_180554_c0_seq1.p1 gnl/TRDRNA2_/TRDRNA2_180554_c0~~gnl/TRDRNA2_/TRDRNA2_180554_c0_seq1.p1  ORF type:complete len:393 (-),score=75.40 gnl/TRDRNA2_/TRDRNA2_180554_c0_seq1:81-1259(-)